MSSATAATSVPGRPSAAKHLTQSPPIIAERTARGAAHVAEPAAAPVAARRTTAGRPSSVRLTRRGRAVVATAVLVGALALAVLVTQAPSLAHDDSPAAIPYEHVVVHPGQTLWQIAVAWAPDVDPRVTIMRIQDLNGLPDAAVTAGQRIALPPRS